jgi:ATP-dependent protease ClpP protease subunit
MADAIFKKWNDYDFYGPKATHVFLYGQITSHIVQRFRTELHEACKVKTNKNTKIQLHPKPIVVHIHSPGGDASLGIAMANFIREVPVPLAIIVDGYACSAVTPLLVASPYRIMHEFSFVLLHGISIKLEGAYKNDEMGSMQSSMGAMDKEYRKIYEINCKIPKTELDTFFSRDMFTNAENCKKYHIVDRIIYLSKETSFKRWDAYAKQNPNTSINNNPLSWKMNLNHLFNYGNANADADANVNTRNSANSQKAMLNLIKPMHKIMTNQEAGSPMPVVLHTNLYMTPKSYIFDIAALMVHVFCMKVPVIGVIDSNIDILKAIPCIMSWKRFMYDNATISISLAYTHNDLPGHYYDDIKYNTELIRSTLKRLFKQYTKLPEGIANKLFEKRIMLDAKQCKAYGFIDEIISSNKRQGIAMTGGNCTCSQGLPLN